MFFTNRQAELCVVSSWDQGLDGPIGPPEQ